MLVFHCSDLHLGKYSGRSGQKYYGERYLDFFSTFEKLIQDGIEKGAEVIILSGDIFDSKELNPDVLIRCENILKYAAKLNIPIIATDGNHDAINLKNTDNSWLIYLEKKGLLKIPKYYVHDEEPEFCPITINEIEFYGLGYNGYATGEMVNKLCNYLENKGNSSSKKILLIHSAVISADSDGEQFVYGTINPETADLLTKYFIYIAGGHLHSYHEYPKNNPCFYLPGAPEFCDNREILKKKGGILFDTVSMAVQFIEAKGRKVLSMSLVINDVTLDEENIAELLKAQLDEENDYSDVVLFLELKCMQNFVPNTEIVETLLNRKFFKVFAVNKYYISDIISDEKIVKSDIDREIELTIEYTGKEFAVAPDLTVKYTEEFKRVINDNNSNDLTEIFDTFLDEFCGDVENDN